MKSSIKGKVAYITGGSKGIGFSIAKALIDEGAMVAISSRNGQQIQEATKSLSSDPNRILGIVSDVRNAEDEIQAIKQIVEKWGKLDILVANAGIGHFASIQEMTYDQWNDVIDINLTGVFNTVKPAIQSLKKSSGYIFTIASLAGTNFFAGGTAYNASKFGLVGMTQAMMLDLRHDGIKVSTLMPGSVSTYFNNRVPNEADAWKIQPADLGQIVVDLLKIDSRTLPSKIEIRPSIPPKK
jgi:NAD(P)-dependent dehydrogenase (short-subunit alcohol dehydrogenase family)